MKMIIIGICCALYSCASAQTTLTKTYSVPTGKSVNLDFDYPVVKVSTWQKNEVSVVAHVNINNGENDNAFSLEDQNTGGQLTISGQIKDIGKLKHQYTIVRDGKKTVFRSKEDYVQAQKSGNVKSLSEGPNIEIVVEVKVPVNVQTNIKSTYGVVELSDFNGPVTVDATYGGIDVTMIAAKIGKLQATTSYGQIYSNLNLKISDHTQRDFFNSITAEPGNGPSYQFTSTYGKIYLRKP